MGYLEKDATRRCAEALAALQAVSSLLQVDDEPSGVATADRAMRLMAAVEAVRVAERATYELRAVVVELATAPGLRKAAQARDH